MATLWQKLDQHMRDLNAQRPDGTDVDARLLPGWTPHVAVTPEGASTGGRDAQGRSLDDWERMVGAGPVAWPGPRW